ncbi:MAG: formylglycine-generating enzyme family protein [Desulfobacterales bacterium]|nr:formylglycine-generating enzyme family protein [Desulfobacterales bacterium]
MPRLSVLFLIVLLLAPPCFGSLPENRSSYLPKIQKKLNSYKNVSNQLKQEYRKKLREAERIYFREVNTLMMEEPPRPKPKGIFETTAEYKKRIKAHRQKVQNIRAANKKAVSKREKKGGIRARTSKVELDWLQKQLRDLSPLEKEISRLQQKGCIMNGEGATMTLHRPEADAFRFPVTINHRGTLYHHTWSYCDRSEAETIWNQRHEISIKPLYRPEPKGKEPGINLKLSTFLVVSSDNTILTQFDIASPKPFEASLRLDRIKKNELPAAKILIALSKSVDGPLPGMRFVFISPRQYTMGSPRNTPGRREDESLHKVKITRPFYIMTTEVTQNQWEKVMGYNPSAFPHCGGDCPIDSVYWQDVMRFIARLNAMHKGKGRFRLPTEAEWEYTARAGREDPWITSGLPAEEYGWYRKNAEETPHPVATRKSNLWNLYDMNGNVAEWTADWYGPYPETPVENPQGPLKGKFRVSRGGSWFHGLDGIRGSNRNTDNNDDKSGYIGFRLVMDFPAHSQKKKPLTLP